MKNYKLMSHLGFIIVVVVCGFVSVMKLYLLMESIEFKEKRKDITEK